MKRLYRFCCLLAPLLSWLIAPAQTLFSDQTLMTLTLEAELDKFLADRGTDPQYHQAALSYAGSDGQQHRIQVAIRARGHFRRDQFVCQFPPVRVKFPKNAPAPFAGQDKLKLVTHCQDDETILREYYVYKTYNILTDTSFRVRLVKIIYQDTDGTRPPEEHFGFFIESEEEMAARLGEKPVEDDVPLDASSVHRNQLTMVHMFNYMIANRDFDVQVRQNIKVITHQGSLPIPVPYDFDWSGVVNAPYTKTNAQAQKPIYWERRIFKPICREEAEIEAVLTHFRTLREQIETLYKTSPYLQPQTKTEILKYYQDFYKVSASRKTMLEVFLKGCR
ncbi:MAG: hypothetical protein SF053_19600 [Bacteroidia bacterium]|nr:hypothetical protein [Bacteroidia bacterium]